MAKSPSKAAEALQVENSFIAGARANLEDAKGQVLRGDVWNTVEADDSDELRALMAGKRMYDRALLKQMPQNRRVSIRGAERRFFFWKRETGVAVVSCLSPLEDILDGESGGRPIGLNEVAEHVRGLSLDAKCPHLIGVCSTTGFTEEARNARHDYPNVMLVLVEPREGGGWRVTADDDVPKQVRELFDPESQEQKNDRVRAEIRERAADLLTGGLSASSIATRLDLPKEVVARSLREIAKADPELRLSGSAKEPLLYRGAPVATREKSSMSFVNKIREMFSKEGDESAKINLLSERRAALAERRDRLYEDIGKLETKEADLLEQGRKSESQIVRRRLATQLAQLRKDIARSNTTTNMLNQQINIISTNIHNLTLIQQGQMASLPDSEELTENAVKAEEMLETLKADADLVGALEAGVGDVLTSQDELDILAEFEAPQKKEAASERTSTPQVARQDVDDSAETADFDALANEPDSQRRKIDPEAT